jgi:glycosyltransferase involved in cell wall biosynthesis
MTARQPLISICIPAYKRIEYLQRLLQSIADQSHTDFEVIVTDDSPDETVRELCHEYQNKFSLFHYRNAQALGTPENWNQAIRNAKGKWIKLMHDDDWFLDQNSLRTFADKVQNRPDSYFVFSAYRNVYSGKMAMTKDIFPKPILYKMLLKNPAILFSGNVIGPPSCVIYKQKEDIWFDRRLKWLVDIDFYIRYLSDTKPVYIPSILVNIGISDTQVTKDTFGNRNIEIPEYFLLLTKTGPAVLGNVLVFDAWWRLMRNMGIRKPQDIREAGHSGEIHRKILFILKFQSRIPHKLLNSGLASKIAMTICFIVSKWKSF